MANDAWSRQRVQEMFFYLLTNPRRTTYQIGADLWSDLDPSKVTNNLYVTVSRLRKAIDIPDCVVSEDGRYSIRVPQLWVDVHEFQEAIDLAQTSTTVQSEIRQLDRAVGLYQGEFLADFPATSNDSWIRIEREQHRSACERALERLIDYWTAQGDEQQAQKYVQLHTQIMGVDEASIRL